MNGSKNSVPSSDREDYNQLTNDLVQLIGIHSENPGSGEGEIAEWLRSRFESLGLKTICQQVAPRRPNIVAFSGQKKVGGNKREGILLNGHMDTVRLVDQNRWSHDPYGGEVKNGRIYGLGSCDMKAGLACMVSVARHLVDQETEERQKEPVAFTAVCDEEGKDTGAEYLVRSGLLGSYRGGIVMEPTSLKISIAQNGFMDFRVVCSGKAAHASRPHLGKNAIYGMNELSNFLRIYERKQLSSRKHELIGSPTINIGYIKGGEDFEIASIVPERCEMVFERRIVPGENIRGCEKEIMSLVARARKSSKGFDFRITKLISMNPLALNRTSEMIVSLAKHRSKFIRSNGLIGVPYYTEAEVFTHRGGIPSVVFGPGNLSLAHAVDEHVKVDEMLRAVRILESFLSDECFAD